jgi:ribonuclease Z
MLTITMLGTAAAVPTVDRNVTSIAIQREGELLLFDCGEGTQRQMMKYGVGFGVNEIFFTHYHADHLLGLTGLLRTMGMQDRTAPMTLYGPRPAKKLLQDAVMLGVERNRFPVEIVEVAAGDRLSREAYDIVAFAADHRPDSLGYALAEHVRLGRFQPERAREFGIPEGPLWGKLHKGERVPLADGRTVGPEDLVGPTRAGRLVVFSGDSRPTAAIIAAAAGADLIIHDATFGDDEQQRAVETGHSTAREAARVARDAGARRLLLTHISARYTRDAPDLLAEARSVFPETMIARDGMSIEVPFADADATA